MLMKSAATVKHTNTGLTQQEKNQYSLILTDEGLSGSKVWT